MTEEDILKLVYEDEWMMGVLFAARELNLPDWMIGAGFIRGKVWDVLHNYNEKTPIDDIDLIYFDKLNMDEGSEKVYEKKLKEKFNINWSVKNQARMHIVNGEEQYISSADALSHWVETPTCVAVTLDADDRLFLIAPHGIDDLVDLKVRPNPAFTKCIEVYKNRTSKKNWKSKWPKLKILYK